MAEEETQATPAQPAPQPRRETSPDEIKGIISFIFIAVFLYKSFTAGLDAGRILVLISGLIAVSGLELDKEKQMEMMKGLVLALIWGTLFFVWFLSFFPDSMGTIYFLMFVTAASIYLPAKNAVVLISLAILSIWAFEASFLGFVVMLVVALFIFATTQEAIFGVVMMVPLLVVGWFVGSGWGDIVEQKVTSIGTQISSDTGISTGSIGAQLSSALNNTLLMLTDPNKWYEKQFATQGTRDAGATSSALEVTKIESLPPSVLPKDTFDVVFELENKGNKKASDVQIGARANTLADACGMVSGKYCLPECAVESGKLNPDKLSAGCPVNRNLTPISQLEKRFESFSFRAPECPGTYSVGAAVAYSYTVEATLNLQMISRNYYQELLRNNKMKWVNELSTASAGPFKLTLRADRDQPIPDTETDLVTPQLFKVYLGLVNEHQGSATMHYAILNIPKDLELISWDDASGSFDESCSITYDIKLKNADPATASQCKLNPTDSACLSFAEATWLLVASKSMTKANYDLIAAGYRTAAKDDAVNNDGFIKYKTIELDPTVAARDFSQAEWRYYKCGFQLEKGTLINQIQTLFVRAELPYTFKYDKSTTVTVRSTTGVLPPDCKKELQVVSAIDPAQKKQQTKDDILNALIPELFYCYNKNTGIWNNLVGTGVHDCKTIKLDMEGCVGNTITLGDVYTRFKGETDPELLKRYDDMLANKNVYLASYDDKTKKYTTFNIKDNPSEILASDKYVVSNVKMEFIDHPASILLLPGGWLFWIYIVSGGIYPDGVYLVMDSKTPTVDPYCIAKGGACVGAGEGNCQPGLLCTAGKCT